MLRAAFYVLHGRRRYGRLGIALPLSLKVGGVGVDVTRLWRNLRAETALGGTVRGYAEIIGLIVATALIVAAMAILVSSDAREAVFRAMAQFF